MRETIFRGKRVRDGEWIYGSHIHLNIGKDYIGEGQTWIGTLRPCMDEVVPETVGQYTGLTDKNGKKIFEGDVVQTAKYGKDSGTGCNFAGKDTFLVCFEDCGFCLRNKWRRFNLRADTDYEAIGNIYDNPELMEGGNG